VTSTTWDIREHLGLGLDGTGQIHCGGLGNTIGAILAPQCIYLIVLVAVVLTACDGSLPTSLASAGPSISSSIHATAPESNYTNGLARMHPEGFFPGWFISPNVGWLIAPNSSSGMSLFRTDDGGHHWTQRLVLSVRKVIARDISFVDQSVGFIVVEDDRATPWLVATTDAGAHWIRNQLMGLPPHGIDFVSAAEGWVLSIAKPEERPNTLGAPATILYHTTNGGSSWRPCESSTGVVMAGINQDDHLEGVRFADANHGWIGGWMTGTGNNVAYEYYYTSDGCSTWKQEKLVRTTPSHPGTEAPLFIGLPEPMGNGVASSGTLYRHDTSAIEVTSFYSSDGGSGWRETTFTTSTTDQPEWVSLATSGAVFAAPTDSGNARRLALPGHLTGALQFVNSDTGFLSTASPDGVLVLMRTDDGGKSWRSIGQFGQPST